LAELDNFVAAAYTYLKSTRGRPYADQVGIPYWRLRQACHSDASCIRQRQIEALAAYKAAGAPVLLPSWVSSQEPAVSGGETVTTAPSSFDPSSPSVTFLSQALEIARRTPRVPFYGDLQGFVINYAGDRAVVFDREGDPVKQLAQEFVPISVRLMVDGAEIEAAWW
jgi:hypothetical protein